MSISSVSSNHSYLPMLSAQAETGARSQPERQQNLVLLSDQGKQLLSAHAQFNRTEQDKEKEEGTESVQVSSSIGRLSRITGLQREEVAALYRSIDKLT
ncbi:hypothetical protein HGG82_07060 [Marinomonas sp. M1K-6]|uniref:Uncharacterized protein n=1 Tax=Marinomonas profundi TaxID=2726122 RepID=A0A847R8W9_9GAMM|nr:hypothetical protein [Marinomonas profundi]NLQ17384.1 hypothetical protein [Marinomonas profundi]UDV01910.1 hypothetical protein J8N69_09840 [Marinomonas profundi]